MTIRIPKKTILDYILAWFGKSRGVIIPAGTHKKTGPHSYVVAKRENIFKALFRSKNSPLPERMLSSDELIGGMNELPHRHEILFCHAFLSFLESQFPGANFWDDLQGHSRTEFFFIHNDSFYLVETKSESETEGSKHPGWLGSFQEIRNKII